MLKLSVWAHVCVCVWRWLWNSACHAMLLQPLFNARCQFTHPLISCSPIHDGPHLHHSFLRSLLPCLLFLPPSIFESFPLTKSFFGLSTHSRKTPTVAICVLCHQYPFMGKHNTWSNSTLLYKMFKTKQRTAAFILFHSILYCKTPSKTHEVVIQCHKTCRASCLFALKMLHKVVQLFHWIIDWSVCMQTPTCRSHISESLLACTSISNKMQTHKHKSIFM